MKAAAVVLACTLAGAALADETPSATATASKTEAGVAEPFTVEVKATGPAGTTWTFPEEAGNDSVDLRTLPPPPGASPEALPAGVHRYQAAAFALGEVEVPAVPVKYRLPDGTQGEARTAPLKLRIASILPKDPAQRQLADIRGPMALSVGLPFWLALASLLLLLAGLVYWLIRRRRPVVAAEPAVPELSGDDEARRALDVLAASDLLARGQYRAYYIALTEIAKRYLERRLQAPVREMTSAETVGFLREHVQLHDLAFAVRELTTAADQVKFAQGGAAVEEGQRHMAVVRQLVEEVEARLRPQPAEKVA